MNITGDFGISHIYSAEMEDRGRITAGYIHGAFVSMGNSEQHIYALGGYSSGTTYNASVVGFDASKKWTGEKND